MLFPSDLSPLFRASLTSLFSSNGKFSISTLKIYSSRIPSPKSKTLGLPRGDKTEETYLLFYGFANRLKPTEDRDSGLANACSPESPKLPFS